MGGFYLFRDYHETRVLPIHRYPMSALHNSEQTLVLYICWLKHMTVKRCVIIKVKDVNSSCVGFLSLWYERHMMKSCRDQYQICKVLIDLWSVTSLEGL